MQKNELPGFESSKPEILPLQVAAVLPGFVYQLRYQPEGKDQFTFLNGASRWLFGLEPEDILKDVETYRALIHPGDREPLFAAAKRHNETLEPWSEQFRMNVQGKVRWMQSTAHLERMPDGTVQWTGFITDISRIKQAEVALRFSEERFGQAWKSSGVGMALVSLDGHWLEVNPSLCKFTGLTADELTRCDFQSITHPDDLASDLDQLGHLIKGEISNYSMEKRYLHRDGHYVWGLLTVAMVKDEENKPAYFLSQVQDIDQRKRVEENLRISEERIALAAQAGHVGMWDYYFDTKQIVWNDAQFDIHGVSRETYVPSTETNFDFLHPDDRSWVSAAFDHCIASGSNRYEVECRIIRPNGEIRTTRSNALIIRNEKGEPLRAVGTEVDITEQQQLLETLASARRSAEAAARAKSEFLARMSHEIRTPLNAIMAPGQLLAASKLSSSQEELTSMILGAGEHLLQVINDILDFSKLEAGKMKVVSSPFDVVNLSSEVMDLMSILARNKGLALAFVVAPDMTHGWQGDAGRIKQILINLVSNAIKYTAEGKVTLRLSRESGETSMEFVRFEVIDTGMGILPEEKELLFQPFEQAQLNRRDWQGGTGLGLAICRDLVELMGGAIGCESAPGEGSEFWFTIPLQAVDLPPLPQPIAPGGKSIERIPDHTTPAHILVAEDNVSNRRVVALLLERLGYTCRFAVDGKQAVREFQKAPCHLILMDCEMPHLNGLESTKQIRRLEKDGRHIPIIALTAHVSAEHRRACLEAGMDDLLSKPVMVNDLKAALARWLSGR